MGTLENRSSTRRAAEPHGTLSERGFKSMDPIPVEVGNTHEGTMWAQESSAAMEPHVRVYRDYKYPDYIEPTIDHCLHMTVDEAEQLIAQLRYIIDHHYQNER